MIRIAITPAAFEAIAATLPLGGVGYENAVNEDGERCVWLEPQGIDRLRAMRGPGVSYSDVIRLVAAGDCRAPILARSHAVSARPLFPPSATVLCSTRRG